MIMKFFYRKSSPNNTIIYLIRCASVLYNIKPITIHNTMQYFHNNNTRYGSKLDTPQQPLEITDS